MPPLPWTTASSGFPCCGDNGSGWSSPQAVSNDPDELLCCEDILGTGFSEVVGCGSDLDDDDRDDDEEEEEEEEDVTALLVEAECNLDTRPPLSQLQSRTPGWQQSVEWILRVRAHFRFQPVTAYLALSYMDRFLRARSLVEEATTGWPMQLLFVACLSLAAKMEETVIPSLIDLQMEGSRFVFEQSTISRMELLVLGALSWRLQSLTPFHLIALLARKAAGAGTATLCCRRLAARATHIVLGCMQEDADELLEYYPSVVAATAVVLAGGAVPGMASVDLETALTWWPDMDRDQMASCHRVMGRQRRLQGQDENPRLLLSQRQSPPDSDSEPDAAAAALVPTSTTTTTTTHMTDGACSCTPISSSSPTISTSSHSSNKRRKVGSNGHWVKDDSEPQHK